MTGALLQNYLVTLYRALTRQRLYAALNILGLAAGVAVFLVLLLDVRFETSFDRWIPAADQTYRLDETLAFPGLAPRQSAKTSSVIAALLEADYPQVVAYTHLIWDPAASLRRDLTTDREDLRYVDPGFFRVLALPLVRGDPATALASPDGVVVTQAVARKYFGAEDVVGRTLTLTEDGVPTSVRVSAVLRDLPPNTHLKLGVLKVLTPQIEKRFGFGVWPSQFGSTYLRFRNPADAAAVQADLANFVERRAKGEEETKLGPHPTQRLKLRLTPLSAIHFEPAITSGEFTPNVDRGVVTSLAAVGALTLAIAILNYINLATARSGLRAKEVAVRKTLGATRGALIAQFLAESTATAVIAVLAGLALTELALPVVNAAGGLNLKVRYEGPGGVLPILGGVTLFVGLAAGLYPALVLSSFQPARVLASSRTAGGGRLAARVRDGLVLIQFSAAIGFAITTLVLSAQSKFVQEADRGFRHDGLILVESFGSKVLVERQPLILDALRRTPGVEAATSSSREPDSQIMSAVPTSVPGAKGHGPTLTVEVIGPDYFRTFGARLVVGRLLDGAHGLDDTFTPASDTAPRPQPFNVMLNQAAVASLGFGTPTRALGRTLRIGDQDASVVGVARDIRFMSPHDPVQPLFYVFNSRYFEGAIAAIRFGEVEPNEMLRRLRQSWRAVAPADPFVATPADVRLGVYYVGDQRRARLFVMGAGLALAIACLGLYGLASFNTARRYREIGIRKTLGASAADVARRLLADFLRPVLLANLVAWPLAWIALRAWLAGFDQRIDLNIGYFLAAFALTTGVALLAVGGHAWRAAAAEPARALRYE